MEITPEIITDFREVYEEFADTDSFSDDKVTRALCKGDSETGSNRWGIYADCSLKQEGLFAFAAHWLVTRRITAATTLGGGLPGSLAPTTSKAVGDESQSFGAASAQSLNESGNAALASTVYGQEFIRLRGRAGMGAVAV